MVKAAPQPNPNAFKKIVELAFGARESWLLMFVAVIDVILLVLGEVLWLLMVVAVVDDVVLMVVGLEMVDGCAKITHDKKPNPVTIK